MSNTVFLLLGTNLGDRARNIEDARINLERFCKVIRMSSLYSTAAWGKTDQPDFYNQVLEVTTALAPHDLLHEVLSVEATMGRQRLERWGERVIDIDILIYGKEIIQTETLAVPHPQMQFRRFTLVPLAEIAGEVKHPTLGKTISDLLNECSDVLEVTRI